MEMFFSGAFVLTLGLDPAVQLNSTADLALPADVVGSGEEHWYLGCQPWRNEREYPLQVLDMAVSWSGRTSKMMKILEFDHQELLFKHSSPTNARYASVQQVRNISVYSNLNGETVVSSIKI